MEKDTAGNIINVPIQNCYCGLTGGCDYCRLSVWKKKFNKDFNEKHKELFPLQINKDCPIK